MSKPGNVKARLFAMYLGQKVYCNPEITDGSHILIHEFLKVDIYLNCAHLLLRSIESLTDEEAIQVARFAHQMPKAPFEVVRRDDDIMHVEYLDGVAIRYHISIRYKYATIGANWHFEKTETDEAISYTHNIGSISTSSERPIPYIAIVDYLRSIGVALPFTFLDDNQHPPNIQRNRTS